jgi:hypothetical protein
MVCVTLQAYTRACSSVTGGLSDIALFDPLDIDFTQVTTDGIVGPYTVATATDAANTAAGEDPVAIVFVLNFLFQTGERVWKQSVKGCSVTYDHEVHCQLPQLSNDLTNFLSAMDAGGCCCGLGIAVRHNDGKIFILGERSVNGILIPRWIMQQDGSDGATGKIFQDYNGVNLVLKGSYLRDAYEYTGTWDTIIALTASAV